MKKKLPCLFTAVFFLGFAVVFLYLFLNSDARRFRQASENFFVSSLSGDSLSLHYTLADPSPYLKEPDTASLPVYSSQRRQGNAALMENLLTALWEIDPEKLKEEDAWTWSLMIPWLENELALAECEYLEEPLSASSGMQTELPILLAEYAFRDREDLTDYLELLESVPDYLEGLAEYEKEKAAAGLFMTEADAAEVTAQCDAILEKEALEAGEHFLQTTFAERLDGLIEKGEVQAEERERYLSENDRLLKTVMAPAFEALGDAVFLLSGSGRYDGGLAQMPGGMVYYTCLLKQNTGSGRTPEEITQLLSDRLQSNVERIRQLSEEYRQLSGKLPESSSSLFPFPFENAQEILEDLKRRMQEDFPAFPAEEGMAAASVSCTAKTVSESLRDYTAPAFYLTPPLDDVTENVIYINPSSTRSGLELYTTLAHEGYPGHLYQTVYHHLYEASRNAEPVRAVLSFGGYAEGWAYYMEILSYGYAADVLAENGASGAEQLLVQILGLERELQINLYCLLDLSIHYYGAGREDVYRTLAAFGISEQQTADAVYDYVRREPTTYLKYYLSFLELLSLKEEAQTLWKEGYSDLRFHTFLLQAGPSDFLNLKKRLQASGAAETGLSIPSFSQKTPSDLKASGAGSPAPADPGLSEPPGSWRRETACDGERPASPSL